MITTQWRNLRTYDKTLKTKKNVHRNKISTFSVESKKKLTFYLANTTFQYLNILKYPKGTKTTGLESKKK